jgi:hypothetical protein
MQSFTRIPRDVSFSDQNSIFFIYKSHITVLEQHKSGEVLHFRIWTKISCKLCVLYKQLAAADRTSLILSTNIKSYGYILSMSKS